MYNWGRVNLNEKYLIYTQRRYKGIIDRNGSQYERYGDILHKKG